MGAPSCTSFFRHPGTRAHNTSLISRRTQHSGTPAHLRVLYEDSFSDLLTVRAHLPRLLPNRRPPRRPPTRTNLAPPPSHQATPQHLCHA